MVMLQQKSGAKQDIWIIGSFWRHQYPQWILWKSRHWYLRHLIMDQSQKTQRFGMKEALDKSSWESCKQLEIILWEPWITVSNLMTMGKQCQVVLLWTKVDGRTKEQTFLCFNLTACGQKDHFGWAQIFVCGPPNIFYSQEKLKYTLLTEHFTSALNYPLNNFFCKSFSNITLTLAESHILYNYRANSYVELYSKSQNLTQYPCMTSQGTIYSRFVKYFLCPDVH